ncbi:hypothetical protein COO91_10723 (plasmid) [Nostoc flagelliforme CCNUN1]|uniref:Uncharacterized protein n=1 Tax=Nostoc flagelliforme CCNUN1 TaxID=2038116 RepID=A0A2K8T9W5_9NOSO|nr:hypothetical protein [Nostoc flagelliforme]AUB44494.1 hypothetical protein COO91_10723 [Nostoc flagelliforme CCNUN1]
MKITTVKVAAAPQFTTIKSGYKKVDSTTTRLGLRLHLYELSFAFLR